MLFEAKSKKDRTITLEITFDSDLEYQQYTELETLMRAHQKHPLILDTMKVAGFYFSNDVLVTNNWTSLNDGLTIIKDINNHPRKYQMPEFVTYDEFYKAFQDYKVEHQFEGYSDESIKALYDGFLERGWDLTSENIDPETGEVTLCIKPDEYYLYWEEVNLDKVLGLARNIVSEVLEHNSKTIPNDVIKVSDTLYLVWID